MKNTLHEILTKVEIHDQAMFDQRYHLDRLTKTLSEHRLKETQERLQIWTKLKELGNIIRMMQDESTRLKSLIFYLTISNVLAWVVIIIRSL